MIRPADLAKESGEGVGGDGTSDEEGRGEREADTLEESDLALVPSLLGQKRHLLPKTGGGGGGDEGRRLPGRIPEGELVQLPDPVDQRADVVGGIGGDPRGIVRGETEFEVEEARHGVACGGSGVVFIFIITFIFIFRGGHIGGAREQGRELGTTVLGTEGRAGEEAMEASGAQVGGG